MWWAIAITAVFLVIGAWNITIAVLGLFPKFRANAVGVLTKAHNYRNVEGRSGHRIPLLSRYTYSYTVNGKNYRYTNERFYSKRRLFSKVNLVYVKWFPRHAYPNRFKGTNEWLWGISLSFLGLTFLFLLLFD
ncbi:MAG: hypothetical protein E7624_00700 [Ruminococcaceae bacterium]|nr:hypothetical protein [Oscillospiraceae bacterium]